MLGLAAAIVAGAVSVSLAQQSSQQPTHPRGTHSDPGLQGSVQLGGSSQSPSAGSQSGQQPLTAEQAKQMDQRFVKHMASVNQFEIEAGRLVSERVQDPQIKQVAQQTIQDHQQAQQQLKQAAQQANIQVSDDLMPPHRAALDQLRQLPPEQLAASYIFGQVGDHHKNILMTQHYLQTSQNESLKQVARQAMPTLQQHYQHAEQLAAGYVGGMDNARPAGARMGGMSDPQGDYGAGSSPNSGNSSGELRINPNRDPDPSGNSQNMGTPDSR